MKHGTPVRILVSCHLAFGSLYWPLKNNNKGQFVHSADAISGGGVCACVRVFMVFMTSLCKLSQAIKLILQNHSKFEKTKKIIIKKKNRFFFLFYFDCNNIVILSVQNELWRWTNVVWYTHAHTHCDTLTNGTNGTNKVKNVQQTRQKKSTATTSNRGGNTQHTHTRMTNHIK